MNDKSKNLDASGFAPTSFRISEPLFKRLKQAALDRGLNQTEAFNAAIEAWLPADSAPPEPMVGPRLAVFRCRKTNLRIHALLESLATGPMRGAITKILAKLAGEDDDGK